MNRNNWFAVLLLCFLAAMVAFSIGLGAYGAGKSSQRATNAELEFAKRKSACAERGGEYLDDWCRWGCSIIPTQGAKGKQ